MLLPVSQLKLNACYKHWMFVIWTELCYMHLIFMLFVLLVLCGVCVFSSCLCCLCTLATSYSPALTVLPAGTSVCANAHLCLPCDGLVTCPANLKDCSILSTFTWEMQVWKLKSHSHDLTLVQLLQRQVKIGLLSVVFRCIIQSFVSRPFFY